MWSEEQGKLQKMAKLQKKKKKQLTGRSDFKVLLKTDLQFTHPLQNCYMTGHILLLQSMFFKE